MKERSFHLFQVPYALMREPQSLVLSPKMTEITSLIDMTNREKEKEGSNSQQCLKVTILKLDSASLSLLKLHHQNEEQRKICH